MTSLPHFSKSAITVLPVMSLGPGKSPLHVMVVFFYFYEQLGMLFQTPSHSCSAALWLEINQQGRFLQPLKQHPFESSVDYNLHQGPIKSANLLSEIL